MHDSRECHFDFLHSIHSSYMLAFDRSFICLFVFKNYDISKGKSVGIQWLILASLNTIYIYAMWSLILIFTNYKRCILLHCSWLILGEKPFIFLPLFSLMNPLYFLCLYITQSDKKLELVLISFLPIYSHLFVISIPAHMIQKLVESGSKANKFAMFLHFLHMCICEG